MEIIKFIECGRKRKGIIIKCGYCGKDVPCRLDIIKKFCSNKCKIASTRKKIVLNCQWCKKYFERKPSYKQNSKSGFYFCSRTCKEEAQKLGGIKEIMPSHYGTGTYRNADCTRFWDVSKKICVGCENNLEFLLTIHHKDGNPHNNSWDNLEIVCFNCHAKRHLKEVDGKFVYDTKALTPRHLLESL